MGVRRHRWASAVHSQPLTPFPDQTGWGLQLLGLHRYPVPQFFTTTTFYTFKNWNSSRDKIILQGFFFPTKGYVALHFKKLRKADRIWRMLAVKCNAGCKQLGTQEFSGSWRAISLNSLPLSFITCMFTLQLEKFWRTFEKFQLAD